MSMMDPEELRRQVERAREFQEKIQRVGGIDKFIQQNEDNRRMIERAGGIEAFIQEQERIRNLAESHFQTRATSGSFSSNEEVSEPLIKSKKTLPQIDIRKADAEYKSFPSFAEWVQCTLDKDRWNSHIKSLKEWGELTPDVLRRARAVVTRAAAIDTGAIEHLYEVDKGFTFTVATQAATWEATLNKKGPEVRALIESQMDAYEMVLDFATERQPMAEAWIRELHAEICKSQDTYEALTEIGWQKLKLPKGKYKELSNHVVGRDGRVHSYAPVDRTPSEMHKLAEELRSDEFLTAHPILQASYAHYAFVLIHPFADGNGRVARALASVYTYRAESIPLLILMENRDDYIEALSEADKGNYQPFVNFVFERTLDAIRMTEESLRGAMTPQVENVLASFKRLYITRGGYSQDEVDNAGYKFIKLVEAEFIKQAAELETSGLIQIATSLNTGKNYPIVRPDICRQPVRDGGRILVVGLMGPEPNRPSLGFNIYLEVPIDCDVEDEIVLSCSDLAQPFVARITELIPTPSAALQLRISMFVRSFLGMAVERLRQQAVKRLKEAGYSPPSS